MQSPQVTDVGLPAGGTPSTLACRERDDPVETTEAHRAVDKWGVVMDYEKMKALMEASRAESAAPRKAQVKEFPKPDSQPDWKYPGSARKEQIAA